MHVVASFNSCIFVVIFLYQLVCFLINEEGGKLFKILNDNQIIVGKCWNYDIHRVDSELFSEQLNGMKLLWRLVCLWPAQIVFHGERMYIHDATSITIHCIKPSLKYITPSPGYITGNNQLPLIRIPPKNECREFGQTILVMMRVIEICCRSDSSISE